MDTKINFISIGEVHRILKKPDHRGARKKVDTIIGFQSGFSRVLPTGKKFSLAPTLPCHCSDSGRLYGVAIRNHDEKKQALTLFICMTCGSAVTKPFNDFPFIREGSDDHSEQTKQENETLG
jgi:hypothetical protein